MIPIGIRFMFILTKTVNLFGWIGYIADLFDSFTLFGGKSKT